MKVRNATPNGETLSRCKHVGSGPMSKAEHASLTLDLLVLAVQQGELIKQRNLTVGAMAVAITERNRTIEALKATIAQR